LILFVALILQVPDLTLHAQSRQAERGRLGANVTMAIYQYDEAKSAKIEDQIRLPQTFESLEAELTYLKKAQGLEGIEPRHIRSVGLLEGESFREGVFILGDTLDLEAKAQTISRNSARLQVRIAFGEARLLEVSGLELHSFETVALKGGRGRFGVRTFAGPKGEEQARIDAALLMTITTVIVPVTQLRNRPREISSPCDEYGRPLEVGSDDVFIPPIIVERVVPKFPVRRPLAATILVEGIVTPDGRVINIRVLRTFDSEMDSFAVDAFKRYRLLPARLNGRPIHATLREEVEFQIRP